MILKGRRTLDAFIGALTAVLILIPTWALLYLQPEEPYSGVTLVKLEETESDVLLIASFDKNPACTFKELRVLKASFGVWTEVPWFDLEESPGDRLAGLNTLKIGFKRTEPAPDVYQVRTRHMCGDVQTDRVFITITP